jgi:two-component system response regulator QseB
MKILLIEDNRKLAQYIKQALRDEEIKKAYSVQQGKYHLFNETFDLIILDLNLPDRHGTEICRYCSLKRIKTPILVLSAENQIEYKLECFKYGIQDYLTKPFHIKELKARINVITKRNSHSFLKYNNIEIYLDKQKVLKNKKEIKLTKKQLKILKLLCENKETIFTRDEILKYLNSNEITSNTIDVHIKNIRDKLEQQLIETVYSIGYKINSETKEITKQNT